MKTLCCVVLLVVMLLVMLCVGWKGAARPLPFFVVAPVTAAVAAHLHQAFRFAWNAITSFRITSHRSELHYSYVSLTYLYQM